MDEMSGKTFMAALLAAGFTGFLFGKSVGGNGSAGAERAMAEITLTSLAADGTAVSRDLGVASVGVADFALRADPEGEGGWTGRVMMTGGTVAYEVRYTTSRLPPLIGNKGTVHEKTWSGAFAPSPSGPADGPAVIARTSLGDSLAMSVSTK